MKSNLSKILGLAVLLCIASQIYLFSNAPGNSLIWEIDWNNALKKAEIEKKPVLIDFYTDWCPPCKKLAAVTFIDENMIKYLNKENYILIKINPEKDHVAEEKFRVYSYPTLILINNSGIEIDRLLGFRTTEDLIEKLENLKKGIGTLEDLQNRLRKLELDKSNESFDLRWEILSKYIASANFPEAIKLLDKILTLDKDNSLNQASAALFQKGYVYYKWKKYKEALNILMSIQKIYPKSEEAESGFAAAVFYSSKMNEPALTLKILKDYVKFFPNTQYSESARNKIKELEKSQETK